MMVLKPERVLFHCIREPQGYWWDRVVDWEGWVDESGIRRGLVEVLPARDVEFIGSDRRPVHHVSWLPAYKPHVSVNGCGLMSSMLIRRI